MIIMKIFLSCSLPNQLTHCQELLKTFRLAKFYILECNDNEGSEEAAGFRGTALFLKLKLSREIKTLSRAL